MSDPQPTVPYGYCQCGCGSLTTIAAHDNKRWGHVKGQPVRFIKGHARRGQRVTPETRRKLSESSRARSAAKPPYVPPPYLGDGLCECGCGEPTQIAKRTDDRTGYVRGHPVRYINGHSRRGKITHGMSGTSIFSRWSEMVARCTNPRHHAWKDYGGRGITVCARWLDSFSAFYEDMGDPPKGLSLDRIDNNGNYEPGNCRWATTAQQAANRRRRVRRPLP